MPQLSQKHEIAQCGATRILVFCSTLPNSANLPRRRALEAAGLASLPGYCACDLAQVAFRLAGSARGLAGVASLTGSFGCGLAGYLARKLLRLRAQPRALIVCFRRGGAAL